MGIRSRRLVLFILGVAALVHANSGIAHAQLPLDELRRPQIGERDWFGSSMSCDGTTLAASLMKAIDVFEVVADGARWTQRLVVEDVIQPGVVPWSIYDPVVIGDWMFARDDSTTVDGTGYAGAAFAFHREGGVWQLEQTFLPREPMFMGEFAYSLDFDGTTLAIGSPEEGDQRGAVHVYERIGGSWMPMQTLDGLVPAAQFGCGVSVDGDWMLVGASHEQGPGWFGHVHFFERAASDPAAPWEYRQSFQGPGEYSQWFGFHLQLRGRHAVAADTGDPNIGFNQSEGVVTYERGAAGMWVETGLLLDPEIGLTGPDPLFFGSALSLEGDDLLVGSPWAYDQLNSGSVYRYRYGSDGWQLAGKLVPPTPKSAGRLGTAIARAPGLVFVSAPWKYTLCGILPWFPVYACVAEGAVIPFRVGMDSVQYCSCPNDAPCGNTDVHGGCTNVKGLGGVLAAGGSGSVLVDDLELKAWALPAGAPALLLAGDAASSAPFGDGRLCVGGALTRVVPTTADPRGLVHLAPGLLGLAAGAGLTLVPGQSGYFQLAYRDPWGPCGSGINLTNAVRVDFKP